MSDRAIDIAFRALQRYFNCGYEWDEEMWMMLNPRPPALTDDECRIISMEFPLRWTSIRRAFPDALRMLH